MHHVRLTIAPLKKLLLASIALAGAMLLLRGLLVSGLQAMFDTGDALTSLLRWVGIFAAAVLAYWAHIRLVEGRKASELRPRPIPIALGALTGGLLNQPEHRVFVFGRRCRAAQLVRRFPERLLEFFVGHDGAVPSPCGMFSGVGLNG